MRGEIKILRRRWRSVLTFAGMASLWAAIAADTGASLLVVMNGLRLLNARHGPGHPTGGLFGADRCNLCFPVGIYEIGWQGCDPRRDPLVE